MCTSIYLGALSAMAQMAKAVGQPADAGNYAELAERCAHFMEEQLFNGEYLRAEGAVPGLARYFVCEIRGRMWTTRAARCSNC